MDGEFNGICSRYYRVAQQLEENETNFKYLLCNALPYTGQTDLKELDAIIQCNREVQKAKAGAEKTAANMRETESIILKIIHYFEIPSGTRLAGEIPGELAFEIWADENDALHITKTKDLAPLVEEVNIITITVAQ